MSDPILCYVEKPWAYFTTQSLDKQWGDDWNDIPYEHNAGDPYEATDYDRTKGENWQIVKVAFDGDFETPADRHGLNSPYSVEMINAGAVAWLLSWGNPCIAIQAGVTLSEFRSLIVKGNGKVYLESS